MPVILNEEVNLKIECDCGEEITENGITDNECMQIECPKCGEIMYVETGEALIYNA